MPGTIEDQFPLRRFCALSTSCLERNFLVYAGESSHKESSYMNVQPFLRSEVVTALRSRKLLGSAALALGVVALIGIEPGLSKAQARGAQPRVSLPLQTGFFNGTTALYITPEVGVDPKAPAAIIAAARQVAVGFNSNFIPQNFGILPGSPAVDDIFVVTNFAQGNVLASAPHPAGPANTDTNYSPLWQVSLVTWVSGRTPRVLTSQTDITSAVAAGEVTVQQTPIIVECSVIFTPGGGLLPGARVTGFGDDQQPGDK
jgi:hypothetical protein